MLLAIALGLLAAFAFTITPVSAQDSDDYDPTFVPEGDLPIGSIVPTKDEDELPVMKRPADIPDDWLNIVPGEPLPDSMKDQRDASLRAPAPEGLEVTSYDDNSISLEWEETTSTAPVIAYLVEIKEGTGDWVTQQTVFNRTTATASGLDCDTSYSFRVRAGCLPDGVWRPVRHSDPEHHPLHGGGSGELRRINRELHQPDVLLDGSGGGCRLPD